MTRLIRFTSGLLFLILIQSACRNTEVTSENYHSSVMELRTYEGNNPKLFLEAEGYYRENFWGDEFHITVEITNKAKIASYKDVKLRIIYYSKTKSVIGTKDYIVYEVIPPQRVTKVNMKIDNYKDVNSIGWKVIDAVESY